MNNNTNSTLYRAYGRPIFVKQETPRENNYNPCWTARTGNIITTSNISEDKAVELHKKKLLAAEYERINRSEHLVELCCLSY